MHGVEWPARWCRTPKRSLELTDRQLLWLDPLCVFASRLVHRLWQRAVNLPTA